MDTISPHYPRKFLVLNVLSLKKNLPISIHSSMQVNHTNKDTSSDTITVYVLAHCMELCDLKLFVIF